MVVSFSGLFFRFRRLFFFLQENLFLENFLPLFFYRIFGIFQSSLLCRFWRRCSCCSCSSSSSWRIRASSKRLCLCCAAFLYIHLLHLRIISNMDFWVISTREIIMDTAITYVPTVPKACTHSLQRMPPTRPLRFILC